MLKDLKKHDGYLSARYLLFIFVALNIISFLYSVITGTYNGDFLGTPVSMSYFYLSINLFFTLLPFLFTWKVYLYFKKRPTSFCFAIQHNILFDILIIFILWNIVITTLFGVAIAGAEIYDAPSYIKPFIQIGNRFNCSLGMFLYVLATPKNNKKQIILILLLLFLSYLRGSIGIIAYTFMLFIIKYTDEITYIVRKKTLKFLVVLLLSLPVISSLYDIRNTIRGSGKEEINSYQFFLGRVAGRFSSFPNSSVIYENAPYFYLNMQNLEEYYFQKQAISGIIGGSFVQSDSPEKIIFRLNAPESTANASFIAGVNGGLYLAIMKSFPTFIYNLLTYIAMIISIFIVAQLIKIKYSNELSFMLLLFLLNSGVPNEYSSTFFSMLIFAILFSVLNFIKIAIARTKIMDPVEPLIFPVGKIP